MTGRELIMYILENNLENEEVFKNGRIIGFLTVAETAAKFNVGVSTIRAWISTDLLYYLKIGDVIYIPATIEDPRKIQPKIIGLE